VSTIGSTTKPRAAGLPKVHVNLFSADEARRDELLQRLDGDARFTVAARSERPTAERGVLALDVAGPKPLAVELVRHLARRAPDCRLLAVVADEDDLELGAELLLAGAAGVASLRQPASGLCEAVMDVAVGVASVSPALEADLVRRLQAAE
jgi:DNA-binding NarL/FixJ family response regulator